MLCDMFSLQILGCVSREFQKNVVYSVLSGHDTLCIQGTGSGKTWAFTLILLVGLMADHVSDFNAKIKLFKPPKESIFPISKFNGIHKLSGAALGSLDASNDGLRAWKDNELSIIWMSPEYLFETAWDLFKSRSLDHGLEYRPSYLSTDQIKIWHPNVPMCMCTATITPAGVKEMFSLLGLKDANVNRLVGDVNRRELFYMVVKKKKSMEDTLDFMVTALQTKDTAVLPAIIFCNDRQTLLDIFQRLRWELELTQREYEPWFITRPPAYSRTSSKRLGEEVVMESQLSIYFFLAPLS
ncbi:hypothetical protein BC829DRAFT_394129 [Chytridium lagenaria]|nr:hypothetical protein BC829DRAFT_394129 [Chytridium lagenaria]